VPLVLDGAPLAERNAFVVAGASAELMVTYDVEEDFLARDVSAELTVVGAAGEHTQTVTAFVDGGFAGAIRNTPFSFSVPAGVLGEDASYSVSFVETTEDAAYEGDAAGARFPKEGHAEIGAESMGEVLRVVLVPFVYNADGSGRLPPLDEGTLSSYRGFFAGMFPNTVLDMTVREPVVYNRSITAGGGGWDTWLDTLVELRESDDPPANTYYYGFAAPANSFGAYCAGGCVAGLGFVPDAAEAALRASVGIAFTDDIGVYTAMHEVGHTLGRPHAPCGGPAGVDPNYPYQGASIGDWGYDRSHRKWKDPGIYTDIMGYCNQQWISDYTFNKVFRRLKAVNAEIAAVATENATRYRVGLVDGEGNVRWRRDALLARPLVGRSRDVEFLGPRGESLHRGTGQLVPYDHLPGGALYVPVDTMAFARGTTAARVDL